jgi:thiol-disulfide isomerase/thioredoxin
MKNLLLILPLLIILSGCKTKKPVAGETGSAHSAEFVESDYQEPGYTDQATWILGYFKPERLFQPPYSEWYIKGFDGYQFNRVVTDKLREMDKSGITIKIVLGTWCPDSRREVPRFMRIIEAIGFPADQMEFIGVDNVKISPIENYEALGIERVPTFIFFRNNVEAGRIIENPVSSLEQDMLDILIRNEK